MRSLAFSIVGVAVLAAACTGSGYEPQAEADAPTHSTGMLFVERIEGASAPGVQVGARFLRITGVRDEALPDLVGIPAVPQVGVCVEHGVTSPAAAPDSLRAEVRLLDVGTIRVDSEGRELSLQPRRFPDLWNVVSGVLYNAESDMPLGTWRFRATGADDSGIGGFEVSSRAPDPLANVHVNDALLPLAADASLALDRRATAIRWQRGDADDRVAIVFEGNGSLVCGARDEGAYDLDAASTERAREIVRGGGTVTVHRMRTRPFAMQGLDAASLVFDLALRARVRAE